MLQTYALAEGLVKDVGAVYHHGAVFGHDGRGVRGGVGTAADKVL
jgi:hypothetical protein